MVGPPLDGKGLGVGWHLRKCPPRLYLHRHPALPRQGGGVRADIDPSGDSVGDGPDRDDLDRVRFPVEIRKIPRPGADQSAGERGGESELAGRRIGLVVADDVDRPLLRRSGGR